jgi:type II secretory pathway pseudopilin PulG
MDTKAFTLIEMIVAVGTIAILVAIILPAVSAARESARRIRCANNLKQIGLACVNYSQTFGVYPIAGEIDAANPHIALLPYLEQNAMFESFNFAAAGSVLLYSNVTAMRTQVDTYLCPSDLIRVESAATNYAVNDHFDPRSSRRIGPFQG